MPSLAFPTMAEKVLADFRAPGKTKSLAKIAKANGAEVKKEWQKTIYTFDDDTSLEVTGRGKNYSVEVFLP